MVDDSVAALQGTTSMRLDKWLWAARFFKTRSLAVHAIHSGQVSVQGEPAKASRALRVGETVTIRLPAMQRTVRVLGLALMRGSSAAAAALYAETAQSVQARLAAEESRRQGVEPARTRQDGRPTKRHRRDLIQWDRWSASLDG